MIADRIKSLREQQNMTQSNLAVADYINYYNNERIQVKTKWMPPSKYREASMCVKQNQCVQETGYISALILFVIYS